LLHDRNPTIDDSVRRTLDHLLEGFQIIAPDWRYVYVNPAAARHGRSTPDVLEGRIIWEVYPGIEQTPLFGVMQDCMTNRSSRVFDNEFSFPDGGSRWFEIRVQAVPEGICIYSADIHDRKTASTEYTRAGRRRPIWKRLWT
jgi:two-component system cell cycle sensor histidine kinase/response regulator CckA